jgi:RNA-binding protein
LTFLFFERGKSLQRLGLVLNITPAQNIVVKVEKPPKIGETVVDENLKHIGKIFDLFGPVSSPYALIKPEIREPERLMNKQLYALPSKRDRRKT